MSNIVFVEMPAYGHVNPTLPVVKELVQRGEHVIYYNSEEFRAPIEEVGATFRSYPPGVLTSVDLAKATQSGDMTRVPTTILRATESLLPFALIELQSLEVDVVVLDSNALWGHMAARMLSLPTVSLMTTFVIGRSQVRQVRLREWAHMLMRLTHGVLSLMSARSRAIRRFGRAAIPEQPVFPARGGLNIAFLPRSFQPTNTLVDATFRFVGPTIEPATPTRSSNMPAQPLHSKPVVYISLGTLHKGNKDFFHQCFEAFAGMPAQFIVSTGRQTDSRALGAVPPNFIVQPFVPQLEVLRQAAVFITHGGMNSVLEGLYYGVPLVLIPQQLEQLLIGLHVVAQGAGVLLREHVAGKRLTSSKLRHALERIIEEVHYREAAKAVQSVLRMSGGYRQAADKIQAYVAQFSARSSDPGPS